MQVRFFSTVDCVTRTNHKDNDEGCTFEGCRTKTMTRAAARRLKDKDEDGVTVSRCGDALSLGRVRTILEGRGW